MSVLASGLIQVTGEQDSGKTTFALEASTDPKGICFIEDDVKGRTIVDEIGPDNLGMYIDLMGESRDMLETAFYDHCIKMIKVRLPQHIAQKRGGKLFDCLIWDTFAKFENTLQPVVARAPNKFRETYSAKGDIKGAQIWQASFDLESSILSGLQSVAHLVILVSHLKADSLNGVKTGRLVPDSKRPLAKNCFMRVYLRHNPKGAAPIGLILKRPSRHIVTDKGLQTINILPRKMDPITWARIREFWEHPVGDVSFLKGEEPTESDLSYLNNILSDQQMEVFRRSVELVKAGITEDSPLEADEKKYSDELIERVKVDKADGKSIPVIAREHSLTVPEVVQILGM